MKFSDIFNMILADFSCLLSFAFPQLQFSVVFLAPLFCRVCKHQGIFYIKIQWLMLLIAGYLLTILQGQRSNPGRSKRQLFTIRFNFINFEFSCQYLFVMRYACLFRCVTLVESRICGVARLQNEEYSCVLFVACYFGLSVWRALCLSVY